jgi:citrate lyase subunit beta / citryl-CoA lyase
LELHRSWHFVPSHNLAYLKKAISLAADVLVFDLEDGVPVADKEKGRQNLRSRFRELNAIDRQRCYLRVNSEIEAFRRDLRLLRQVGFGGVVLPKVEDPRILKSRMAAIARVSPDGGRIVLIESFRALADLPSILDASPLSGVGLGLEDMFAEVDVPQREVVALVTHVKLRLIVEAKARGLVAIDSVSLEYRDRSKFVRECSQSRSLGFDGMFSIHPNQVGPINSAFSGRRRDIVWARRIARLSSMTSGSGYSKRGKEVLSPPKVRKARLILKRMKEGPC